MTALNGDRLGCRFLKKTVIIKGDCDAESLGKGEVTGYHKPEAGGIVYILTQFNTAAAVQDYFVRCSHLHGNNRLATLGYINVSFSSQGVIIVV